MLSYSFINKNTLKIAIMVIIWVILILTFLVISIVLKKKQQKLIINARHVIIGLLFCILCVDFIPFENLFSQFKSPEQIFHYYYPTVKIIKKYEFDDYAYIYGKDNVEYYIKSNNNWKIPNKKEKPISIEKWCNRNVIQIDQYPDKNISVVRIVYLKIAENSNDLNKNRKISDSLSTKFDMVMENIETTKNSGLVNADYFAVIPQKLDSDYTIYIDDVMCQSLLN